MDKRTQEIIKEAKWRIAELNKMLLQLEEEPDPCHTKNIIYMIKLLTMDVMAINGEMGLSEKFKDYYPVQYARGMQMAYGNIEIEDDEEK